MDTKTKLDQISGMLDQEECKDMAARFITVLLSVL